MTNKTFTTAINCMDGRTQIPVIEFLKSKYGADYVDMITEPGPNKILAENKNQSGIESIKKRVEISTKKHGSKHIAIVGHHECAGNPTDKKTQITHILAAMETVKAWRFDAGILGLWVDENWKVNEIKEI